MPVCSVSDAVRCASRGLAALALLALLAPEAGARTVARAVVEDDSGRVVSRVRISSDGIQVTHTGSDSVALDVIHGGELVVVDSDGAGLVRLFSDARVREGEKIDGDVVAVFGSVEVDGQVAGNAVAVFGGVRLGPSAVVSGDAVGVFGGLDADPGSRVGGESVSIGLLPMTFGLPALPVVLATIGFGWLVSVFFGWMFAVLFPDRLRRVAEVASRRTAASFALGVLSGPLFVVAMVLLAVTVVGIVVAVLMPFLAVVLVYAGQLAATFLLGTKLVRRPPAEASPVGALVAGATLVASLFAVGAVLWVAPGSARTVALFFHLVGFLLLLGLSCIGTGAFLLSRFGSAPRRATSASPVAPAPSAAAPPAPAV